MSTAARPQEGARVAVLIPCFNAGPMLLEAVASIQEPEPVEVVVVDDASTDPATQELLARIESGGSDTRVIRQPENGGCASARTHGLRHTTAPYVFPLDTDDVLLPGMLARMADQLDEDPGAAAAVGDYEEQTGGHMLTRAVPDRLDPFRVAYNNDYAVGALYRRSAVEQLGGWRDPAGPDQRGYEDWDLWMGLAERGARVLHMGPGVPIYRRHILPTGVNHDSRRRHKALYNSLREAHPGLFGAIEQHRRRSDLSTVRKLLYPIVYGDRRLLRGERFIKPVLDRAGIWTLRR
jgi:glycosyltransferase involved in cell wall biosynthesis